MLPFLNTVQKILSEKSLQPLKEARLFFACIYRIETLAVAKLFNQFLLFCRKVLRNPNLNIHQQVSPAVAVNVRNPFSSQSENFAALRA